MMERKGQLSLKLNLNIRAWGRNNFKIPVAIKPDRKTGQLTNLLSILVFMYMTKTLVLIGDTVPPVLHFQNILYRKLEKAGQNRTLETNWFRET